MGCGCKGNDRGKDFNVVKDLAVKYSKLGKKDVQIYNGMGRYNFEFINPTRRGVVEIIRYYQLN
jgi:hypothetical protein